MQNNLLENQFLDAANRSDIKRLESLLNQGVNVDTPINSLGYTALHSAAAYQKFEVLTTLLSKKANIEAVNSDGCTPLQSLVSWGFDGSSQEIQEQRLRTVQILKDHGANIHTINKYGRTLLHSAVIKNRMELIEYFSDFLEIDAKDNRGRTPLHLAAEMNRLAATSHLIKCKANIHSVDHENNTLLHIAARHGSYLPEYNARVINARSPLELIKTFIIDLQHQVNIPNKEGQTPLHLAANCGFEEVAKLLIEHNSNVDQQDDKGRTPLHLATLRNRTNMVMLLTEYNANTNLEDFDGRKAIYYTLFTQNASTIAFLYNKTLKPNANDQFELSISNYLEFHEKVYDPQSDVHTFLDSFEAAETKNALLKYLDQMQLFRTPTETRKMLELFSA